MSRPQVKDGSDTEKRILALQQAAKKLEEQRRQQHEPLAVIGMACRFPDAPTLDEFWGLLRHGRMQFALFRPIAGIATSCRLTLQRSVEKITFNGVHFSMLSINSMRGFSIYAP